MNLCNKGIEVINPGDGLKIVKFFKENGINTIGYTGEGNPPCVYYATSVGNLRILANINYLPPLVELITLDYKDPEEFKYGEKVNISSNPKTPIIKIFIGLNPIKGVKYKYIVIDERHGTVDTYLQCRKYVPKIDFKAEVNALAKRIEDDGQDITEYL